MNTNFKKYLTVVAALVIFQLSSVAGWLDSTPTVEYLKDDKDLLVEVIKECNEGGFKMVATEEKCKNASVAKQQLQKEDDKKHGKKARWEVLRDKSIALRNNPPKHKKLPCRGIAKRSGFCTDDADSKVEAK